MRGLEHSRLLFGKLVGTSFCCSPAIGPKLWVFYWSSMMLCEGGSIACLLCKPVSTRFSAVSQ
ncbi:hypothetical protein RirG_050180 [Rhizophagus irregularis DAOM 197198w]|uniref:Uncharacterized protein n=1 Tax=Rhizophagus irregularis (strain DAOM 197198w) TaxID=1432141 RepID=A0A015K4J1_RHIIW|nr:hypothetical protein RirG_050180 [Rhizophagus irregularis DAOM 197198w]